MNIIAATASYETWLKKHITPLKSDLELKHEKMRESAFYFLRATFYRWMQVWDGNCEELFDCPKVLSVGDLHIENFGTWRDADGRLVWGINDFDEAYPLPYALDLVRLGVSMCFAIRDGEIALKEKEAITALLEGYEKALRKGGEPFVLEERHSWLRSIAVSDLREPDLFWQKISSLPKAKSVPAALAKAIEKQMPERGLKIQYHTRCAGLGSLGRTRVVGIANWRGGLVAREGKNSLPSACVWNEGKLGTNSLSGKLVEQSVRMPDPFWCLHGDWVVRRLAPHCSKIDLSHIPKKRSEIQLLNAMGFETANVHLGDKASKKILKDFTERRKKQIHMAVSEMTQLTLADWKVWREK